MNTNDDRIDNQKSALEDYVTAAIAEDIDLANEYRDILAKNNIPAITATQKSYSDAILGTAVMVPENLLEEAQEIIESQQDFDNYLDDAFNGPDSNNESDPDEYDDSDILGDNDDF